jgi:hypothetical protein
MGLGQLRGPSWWTGSKLPQSDLYRYALRVLCQWISNHYDFKLRSEQSLEREETRGEAAPLHRNPVKRGLVERPEDWFV